MLFLVDASVEDSEDTIRRLENTANIEVGRGQIEQTTIGGAYRFFDGTMDEVRISSTNLTDNWLETEYNNLTDPSSFYDVPAAAEVVNDDPCSAIELLPSTCLSPLPFTNLGATNSGESNPGCNYVEKDVWFKVGVPPGNGKVAIEVGTIPADGNWMAKPNHAVYVGANCSSMIPVDCYSGNSYVQPGIGSRSVHPGLTAGDTVFVRVWDDGGDDNGKFAIAIINDLSAPTLSLCPVEVIAPNDAGQCNAIVTWSPPVAADNCPVEDLYINWDSTPQFRQYLRSGHDRCHLLCYRFIRQHRFLPI